MTDRFGEQIYDRDAALYPGADYPPAEDCPAAVRLYLMDEDELADTEASAAEAEKRGPGVSPGARLAAPTGRQGIVRYTALTTARENARPAL